MLIFRLVSRLLLTQVIAFYNTSFKATRFTDQDCKFTYQQFNYVRRVFSTKVLISRVGGFKDKITRVVD